LPTAALSAAVIILVAAVPLFIGNPPVSRTTFIAAIIDKDENLKRTVSPKIIFVGGSNLAFGLNSQLVEQQFGMPVVNLGLHGILGLNFILEQAKSNINAGDVVIVCPEYEMLTQIPDGGISSWELAEAFFVSPRIFKYVVSFKQIGPIFTSFRLLLDEHRKMLFKPKDYLKEINAIYRRDGFNRYGDMTLHLPLGSEYHGDNKTGIGGDEYDLKRAVTLLNSFNSYVLSRQAKVFLLPPPYPSSAFSVGAGYSEMYARLKQSLKISILASPKQFFFPDQYFYDHVYHLTAQGREVRTRKVISILQEQLNESKRIL